MAPLISSASGSFKLGQSQVQKIYLGTAQVWAPPAQTDPFFSNVELLVRGEGSNGGTVFTDSSSFAKPLVRTGTVTTSTAKFKYGSSSLFFQGDGRVQMSSASSGPWISMGTGLYTVEFWVNVTTQGIMFENGSITITGQFGAVRVRYGDNQNNLIVSGSTLPIGQWAHVAVVQTASDTVLYVNGVNAGTAGFKVGAATISSVPIGNNSFAGYIDEVRITKGVARYTSNFAPPAAAFPGA